MDGGARWATVHGVSKSLTWLSDFTFPFHFHALEKEMATHSSVLAWRIPGMREPGGLPSVGPRRVGHDWSDLAAAAAAAAGLATKEVCVTCGRSLWWSSHSFYVWVGSGLQGLWLLTGVPPDLIAHCWLTIPPLPTRPPPHLLFVLGQLCM